ncbi:DNA-processing protein DprA [Candidatus Gracilibacteria bacterium]|nr:DNA-processing protein DprA [Candidatus Gracilibacteria bacterium]
MITSSTKYLLALHRGLSLTFNRFQKLNQFFDGHFEKAFKANISDFQNAEIDIKGIEKFFSSRNKIDPNKELELLEKCNANVLVFGQNDYPLPLQNISNPPSLLFVRGEIQETDFPSLSVVGSRKISSYGKRVLAHLVGELASQNITIVSGLAFGADALAHRTALAHNCRTLAVLGNGIDEIYPQQNKLLGEEILQKNLGAIISEYLPKTELRPENFPIRNRIVAGLSKGTLIIEAAKKSGTLITASLANDMGRLVFAVPGEIFSKNSIGTNQLLYDGVAHPALSGNQLREDLGFTSLAQKKSAIHNLPKTGIEAEILKVFESEEKLHIDEIFRICPFQNTVISSNLMLLEIKGLVKNIGNQVYVKDF